MDPNCLMEMSEQSKLSYELFASDWRPLKAAFVQVVMDSWTDPFWQHHKNTKETMPAYIQIFCRTQDIPNGYASRVFQVLNTVCRMLHLYCKPSRIATHSQSDPTNSSFRQPLLYSNALPPSTTSETPTASPSKLLEAIPELRPRRPRLCE